tara:strand:- start:172 stop:483 length:312 start_codon:yes stop_codon:yes gene_type:complete
MELMVKHTTTIREKFNDESDDNVALRLRLESYRSDAKLEQQQNEWKESVSKLLKDVASKSTPILPTPQGPVPIATPDRDTLNKYYDDLALKACPQLRVASPSS